MRGQERLPQQHNIITKTEREVKAKSRSTSRSRQELDKRDSRTTVTTLTTTPAQSIPRPTETANGVLWQTPGFSSLDTHGSSADSTSFLFGTHHHPVRLSGAQLATNSFMLYHWHIWPPCVRKRLQSYRFYIREPPVYIHSGLERSVWDHAAWELQLRSSSRSPLPRCTWPGRRGESLDLPFRDSYPSVLACHPACDRMFAWSSFEVGCVRLHQYLPCTTFYGFLWIGPPP